MTATRLLIPGVVRLKQPIHLYDVRRDLELWHAGYSTSANMHWCEEALGMVERNELP